MFYHKGHKVFHKGHKGIFSVYVVQPFVSLVVKKGRQL